MATYIYTRYSPKNKAHSEHLAALREAAPDALHFEDKIRGCVPLQKEKRFKNLAIRFNLATPS